MQHCNEADTSNDNTKLQKVNQRFFDAIILITTANRNTYNNPNIIIHTVHWTNVLRWHHTTTLPCSPTAAVTWLLFRNRGPEAYERQKLTLPDQGVMSAKYLPHSKPFQRKYLMTGRLQTVFTAPNRTRAKPENVRLQYEAAVKRSTLTFDMSFLFDMRNSHLERAGNFVKVSF